jgi:hypothetical protein
LRRPFDPVAHDLDASFRLTRFADLKGWGCKVPQEILGKLLEGLQADDASAQDHEHAHFMHMAIARIGEWILRKEAKHVPKRKRKGERQRERERERKCVQVMRRGLRGEKKRASPLLRRACEPTSLVAACIVFFLLLFFSFPFHSLRSRLILAVTDKNKHYLRHYWKNDSLLLLIHYSLAINSEYIVDPSFLLFNTGPEGAARRPCNVANVSSPAQSLPRYWARRCSQSEHPIFLSQTLEKQESQILFNYI